MTIYLMPQAMLGVFAWLGLRPRRSMQKRLPASLSKLQLDIDGCRVAGSRLQVQYRWTGSRASGGNAMLIPRGAAMPATDDNRLCRAPGGTCVLAIAQWQRVPSQPDERVSPAQLEISWVFRVLAEARARASLSCKRRAYRRVAGEASSPSPEPDAHSPPNSS